MFSILHRGRGHVLPTLFPKTSDGDTDGVSAMLLVSFAERPESAEVQRLRDVRVDGEPRAGELCDGSAVRAAQSHQRLLHRVHDAAPAKRQVQNNAFLFISGLIFPNRKSRLQ